jgi:hypothetical protein
MNCYDRIQTVKEETNNCGDQQCSALPSEKTRVYQNVSEYIRRNDERGRITILQSDAAAHMVMRLRFTKVRRLCEANDKE